MRTRGEIQEEVLESNAENNGNETIRLLMLEALLDIRDQNEKILSVLEDITTNRKQVAIR